MVVLGRVCTNVRERQNARNAYFYRLSRTFANRCERVQIDFGTYRSQVQILSPRPIKTMSYALHGKSKTATEGAQVSGKSVGPYRILASQGPSD